MKGQNMKNMIVKGSIPSFINGVLKRPGEIASVDTEAFGKRKDAPKNDDMMPNLESADGNVARAIVQVASIAPTGPNPTKPQQLPAGSTQIGNKYVGPGGETLVGEAVVPGQGIPEAGPVNNDDSDVEEEGVQRTGETFDAQAAVDTTIAGMDVSGRSADDLDAMIAAEKSGKKRGGALEKLEAAKADLSA